MNDLIQRLRDRAAMLPEDQRAQSDATLAADEIERLRSALREVADPLGAMKLRAQADGSRLDGYMAVMIANDPNHLKGIARKALAESQ